MKLEFSRLVVDTADGSAVFCSGEVTGHAHASAFASTKDNGITFTGPPQDISLASPAVLEARQALLDAAEAELNERNVDKLVIVAMSSTTPVTAGVLLVDR